jgi:hypothetical protein
MLVENTNIKVDLDSLRKDYLKNIDTWPKNKNRICLNNHDGVDDYVKNSGQRLIYTEFKYMNSLFKNTIWEDTLKLIPGKIGRARLMIMPHEKLLTMHRDIEARYHIALFTDPGCIAYDFESNTGFSIPSDGYIYRLDGRRLHTVFNSSNNFTRVHLVVCEYV